MRTTSLMARTNTLMVSFLSLSKGEPPDCSASGEQPSKPADNLPHVFILEAGLFFSVFPPALKLGDLVLLFLHHLEVAVLQVAPIRRGADIVANPALLRRDPFKLLRNALK